jgi:DNA helicase-2/ATP-dependent DNA helicase PcrA
MNQEYLQKLNKDQREAVEYTDGPSIILAGAGSGKTRVLTNKVLHLIHAKKVDANRIAMMTFTNKAASEMKERVGQKLGFIGTFHSLCAMILRKDGHHIGLERNFIIYDSDDTDGIIKSLLKVALTFKTITPSSVQHTISSAKDSDFNARSIVASSFFAIIHAVSLDICTSYHFKNGLSRLSSAIEVSKP